MGNSAGYVRVFDLLKLKVEDLKPYFDKSLANNRVTSIDCTGTHLLVGYKSGALALWEIGTHTLQKVLMNVHESEVVSAKVFHVNDQ
mgnify:CR=1 FL=1